jgi:hypothetical protein
VSDERVDPVVALGITLGTENMSQAALFGLLDDQKRMPEIAVIGRIGGSVLATDLCPRDDNRPKMGSSALKVSSNSIPGIDLPARSTP